MGHLNLDFQFFSIIGLKSQLLRNLKIIILLIYCKILSIIMMKLYYDHSNIHSFFRFFYLVKNQVTLRHWEFLLVFYKINFNLWLYNQIFHINVYVFNLIRYLLVMLYSIFIRI